MGSAEQADEAYQAGIEKSDRIRSTMWDNHDTVVSALTGEPITHEQARQLAQLRSALMYGHPAIIHHAAKTLCEMFDDQIFEYASDQLER